MRKGMYPRLAWENIRRSYRISVPQMIAGAGLLACFYIVRSLTNDPRLLEMKGGDSFSLFLNIALYVVGILSVIMILYTNSFVMKQRKKEFGLYSVLGMERRHICRIMFFEQFFSAVISMATGLCSGLILYYLAILLACVLLRVDTVMSVFYVDVRSMLYSMRLFGIAWGAAYLFNVFEIAKLKTTDLLKSANTGEKEPEIRWILLLIGIVTMGAGYWMALTITNPMDAISFFFVAVILVCVGTYCLFITGFTAVLKMMQKNKKFYYTPERMPVISGLLYRMKQNAAGLASIALMATVVIIAISSTLALRLSMDDTVEAMYPHDVTVTFYDTELTDTGDRFEERCSEVIEKNGIRVKKHSHITELGVAFGRVGDTYTTDRSSGASVEVMDFISVSDYNTMTEGNIVLADGEVLVYSGEDNKGKLPESFMIGPCSFRVKDTIDKIDSIQMQSSNVYDINVLIVTDEVFTAINEYQRAEYGDNASEIQFTDSYDFEGGEEEVFAARDSITALLDAEFSQYPHTLSVRHLEMAELEMMFGSFLFMGLIIGLICIFAAALIIYYKQISEGYEDRERYQIMRKVGMSDKEIQNCIRTQILMVFFVPLLTACIHTCGAFPMVTSVLRIFLLPRNSTLLLCTGGVMGVFAVLYAIIYTLTARTYYRIVR